MLLVFSCSDFSLLLFLLLLSVSVSVGNFLSLCTALNVFSAFTNSLLGYNMYFITTFHLQNRLRRWSAVFGHFGPTPGKSAFSQNSVSLLVCGHIAGFLALPTVMYFWRDRIQCNILTIGLAWHSALSIHIASSFVSSCIKSFWSFCSGLSFKNIYYP